MVLFGTDSGSFQILPGPPNEMLGDGPIFETEDEAQEIGDCEAPSPVWGLRAQGCVCVGFSGTCVVGLGVL